MSTENLQDTPVSADNKTAEERAKEEQEKQARLAEAWDKVNYGQPNENLDPLIDESINEPDIKAGLERTKLEVDYLRGEIKRNDRKQIWEVVTDELKSLKIFVEGLASLNSRLQSLFKTQPQPLLPAGESTLQGCLKGLGGFGILVVIISAIVVLYQKGWRVGFGVLVGQYRYWAIALIVAILLVYLLYWWFSRRHSKETLLLRQKRDLEITGWRQSSGISEIEKDVASASQQVVGLKANVVKGVLEKHLNDRFRTFINQQTTPSYATHLNITSARGLAEVFDPKSAIDTSARNKLNFMLENMPGGSIGIAGPRGAGKTTLLRLFCGPKRILTTLKDKRVLAVLVSAPVAYQPRDFILYLFSTICQNALEAEGEEYPRPTLEQTREAATPSIAPFINLIKPLPRLCIYLGTTLVFLALLFGLLLTLVPAASNEKETARASANTATQANGNSGTPANPQASPQVASASPSPAPSQTPKGSAGRFLGDFVRAMEISPGALLLWGIVLVGVGMLFAALVGEKPLRTLSLSWLNMLSWFPPINQLSKDILKRIAAREDAETGEENIPPTETPKVPRTLKSEARDWLKRIKFQQSYTSGWSGSLKLPVGLAGDVNNAVTLAENQLSLPEISHAFTKFVELASQDYQVIIGIDELDKLEADKDAHLFLNDIKSVFGLEKCFYLVSVSENAMSSFERRGLPFRDVFDSSFDDIIYVDYLNFDSAQKLLEKKVIGRPIPFFGLSYSLSAGLARDLIRNFRAVMEIRQLNPVRNDLEAIGKEIVHTDLRAKIRATSVSAKKVELEPDVDVFLERLYKLESVFQDKPALFQASLELMNLGPPSVNQDKEEEANREKLSELAEELATYVFFAVTVIEFFNNQLTEESLTDPGQGGTLDDLARARQVLAVNLNTTRSILNAFRVAHHLPPRTWSNGTPVIQNGKATERNTDKVP